MNAAVKHTAACQPHEMLNVTDELTARNMEDDLFCRFSEHIYHTVGIRLDQRKKGLVISRLSKRLRKLGLGSFTAYFRLIQEDPEEEAEMLNCISTNTTRFFREPHHFDHLRDRIIPELAERSAAKPIRIWSAGCSTGEEPYSIAITVLEALRMRNIDPAGCDIKVLATDISTRVLDSAHAGIYDMQSAVEGLSQQITARYFLRGTNSQEGRVRVKQPVKDMVHFARLNLRDEAFPFRKEFDVIFCRNVMIYFDEEMKERVISKFYDNLGDQGHLFLGHSETLLNSALFSSVNITVYRKQ